LQGERDRGAIPGGRRGFLEGAASYPRSAPGKKAPERRKIAQEIWKILVDNQYSIGTVGLSPAVMGVRIVSRRMGNIPARQVNAQHARTPCSSHPATFFFKA
jgi:peptide/nickel transport system substrate-binding protein